IVWEPHPSLWYTHNSEGPIGVDGAATAGGIIQAEHRNVKRAYSINMGRCSITLAELRGIIDGMEIAWNQGCRKLLIQTDSVWVVKLLRSRDMDDHQHAALILRF
ncbi:hypothetical protein LINGRAHAP2_LOCUS29139, partial [Linum grandiflorum]